MLIYYFSLFIHLVKYMYTNPFLSYQKKFETSNKTYNWSVSTFWGEFFLMKKLSFLWRVPPLLLELIILINKQNYPHFTWAMMMHIGNFPYLIFN